MNGEEIKLLRDLLDAKIDPIANDVSQIKKDLRLLQEEYDNVLIEQKVTKKFIKLLIGLISISGTIISILVVLVK